MVFVELTPFVACRDEYWSDEDVRALQSLLLVSPEAGALLRGGAGLRNPLAGQGTCRTNEGPEGWIRSTSINWSGAWAR
jgi:hypothetical protein